MKQLMPSEILAKLNPGQRVVVEAPIGLAQIIAKIMKTTYLGRITSAKYGQFSLMISDNWLV